VALCLLQQLYNKQLIIYISSCNYYTTENIKVPNQSISHFYPPDDNYIRSESDPTKRSPKSLTDLCIDSICRNLPNLDGALPSGLPPDVVDRIVQSLTSHASLNSTTLRTLSQCELSALSLANCRGVSDEWLASLSSSVSVGSGMSPMAGQRLRSASNASYDHTSWNNSMSGAPYSPLPLRDIHLEASAMMMDLDEYGDLNTSDYSSGHDQSLPLLPRNNEVDGEVQNNPYAGSDESRSTSSFVSASSRLEETHASPLLPSVLPPPEFFSLNYTSPAQAPSSSLWLYPMRGAPSSFPPLPPRPSSMFSSESNTNNEMYNNETSYNDLHSFAASTSTSTTTSTLTLLDLRGSQRLTDRGLLQLSHTPLQNLEVVKLDNCHGITGRGLMAFSRSHRLHTLSLANCRRLTDDATINISHSASLRALNLDGCRCITDRSLDVLSGLVGLQKLDLSQVCVVGSKLLYSY